MLATSHPNFAWYGTLADDGRACGTVIGIARALMRKGAVPVPFPIRQGRILGLWCPCVGGDFFLVNILLQPKVLRTEWDAHLHGARAYLNYWPRAVTFVGGDTNFVFPRGWTS